MRGEARRETCDLGSVGCQELGGEGVGFRGPGGGLPVCHSVLVLSCHVFSTDIHELLVAVVGRITKHTPKQVNNPKLRY